MRQPAGASVAGRRCRGLGCRLRGGVVGNAAACACCTALSSAWARALLNCSDRASRAGCSAAQCSARRGGLEGCGR